MRTITPLFFLTFLTACMPPIPGELCDDCTAETPASDLSLDDATDLAFELGVSADRLIYADMLPYVISPTEAIATWGFIESRDDGFLVTYIDQELGDVLELQQPAGDNILDFIAQTGLDQSTATFGSSPGSYNSFPWNWRLPMEAGTFKLSCGYGCSAHTGGIYFSTDWAKPYNTSIEGHLLESPASGFVMYTTASSSYGNQIIVEGGSAGNGKEYYYRLAHMRDPSLVSPGWWIGKGRDIGYIGSTGNSTGPHVHYEVIRASSTSGGSFSGADDIPINNWPTGADGICSGAFNGYNFYGAPNHIITVGSNGCP